MIRFQLILAFLSPFVSFAAPALNPSPRDPVLLELFTSEGCSSCPPADRLYTPQLVIDGKFQVVGSDRGEVSSAIGHSMRDPKLPMIISEAVRAGTDVRAAFEVPGTGRPNGTALMYIVLADNQARSSVVSGENVGQALSHVGVARHTTQSRPVKLSIGLTKQVILPVPPGVGANGLRVVVFLQDQGSGHVLGAAVRKVRELP